MKNLSLIFLCIALSIAPASFAMNANGKRPAQDENYLHLPSLAIIQAINRTTHPNNANIQNDDDDYDDDDVASLLLLIRSSSSFSRIWNSSSYTQKARKSERENMCCVRARDRKQ